jgi:hypothetical protein
VVNAPPFFIVGSGRSGTTLLRMILVSHSRLWIPPETWYLNQMGDMLDLDRPLVPQEVERVVQIMTRHYRWPDLELSADEFRSAVAKMTSPFLSDIVEWVYLEHLKRSGKRRWGDKTPGYIELVPQLAHLFPGAKFIHVIRDGRDVAKSFQARRWSGRWLHQNADEWLMAMGYGERWKKSPYAGAFYEVRYEDLVRDQEREVRRVCELLGEEYEPQMLSWQSDVEKQVPAREAHIHEKLGRAPSAEDVDRWQREMSAREVFVSEAFMGPHLKAHGYALRFSSPIWTPLLWLTRWYCLWVLPVASLPHKAIRALRERLFGQLVRPEVGHGP